MCDVNRDLKQVLMADNGRSLSEAISTSGKLEVAPSRTFVESSITRSSIDLRGAEVQHTINRSKSQLSYPFRDRGLGSWPDGYLTYLLACPVERQCQY